MMMMRVYLMTFLKSTYLDLCSCKILSQSKYFENFDDFGGPPSKIRGRGSWAGSMTSFKMAAMDSRDLDLEEKHHVAPPPEQIRLCVCLLPKFHQKVCLNRPFRTTGDYNKITKRPIFSPHIFFSFFFFFLLLCDYVTFYVMTLYYFYL